MYVLVTKIELAESVVSLDGDHDDEYTFGDVSILGRTGFILFLLVVGAGGAVGAYMYSSLRVKMSARSVALDTARSRRCREGCSSSTGRQGCKALWNDNTR